MNRILQGKVGMTKRTAESKELSLLESVYQYVKFAGRLQEDCIFQGGNNSAHLPKKHNNFAVINLINLRKIGTNEQVYTDNSVIVTSTMQAGVQVDMYGNSLELARQNIEPVHNLFHDVIACDFFAPHGFTPLYADDLQVMLISDESKQYVPRILTTLYFNYKNTVELPYQTFSAVTPNIMNVDVKFPPK